MYIVITRSSMVGASNAYYGVRLSGTDNFVMAVPKDMVELMHSAGTMLEPIDSKNFEDVGKLEELMHNPSPFHVVKKTRNKYFIEKIGPVTKVKPDIPEPIVEQELTDKDYFIFDEGSESGMK